MGGWRQSRFRKDDPEYYQERIKTKSKKLLEWEELDLQKEEQMEAIRKKRQEIREETLNRRNLTRSLRAPARRRRVSRKINLQLHKDIEELNNFIYELSRDIFMLHPFNASRLPQEFHDGIVNVLQELKRLRLVMDKDLIAWRSRRNEALKRNGLLTERHLRGTTLDGD